MELRKNVVVRYGWYFIDGGGGSKHGYRFKVEFKWGGVSV